MSEPAPFPKQADELKLRARPRPVTRINRKVLMAGACLGVLGLFVAASIALDPPKAVDPADRQELYNTATKRAPDGLADLPNSYLGWQPAGDTPRLGAPMAGDLGGTVVAEEEEWGLEPDWNVAPSDDFRPSAEDEAIRAQRLADAKVADAAGKAGVFFDVGNRQSPAGSVTAPGILPNSLGSELLALAAQGAGAPGFAGAPDQNLQVEKIAFAAEKRDGDIYNPHDVETPISPYQVMAGTLIPASLVTGLNSDLPGNVIAQVTQPVFDTVSGAHLLIPQGARLIGRYPSISRSAASRSPGTGSSCRMAARFRFRSRLRTRRAMRASLTGPTITGTACLQPRGSRRCSASFPNLALTMMMSSERSGAGSGTASPKPANVSSTAISVFSRRSEYGPAGRCGWW